ncbi:MAG: hypothetical protein K0R03_1831 [Moraxellaceae bacterium]|jgi:predicted Ser/Thr protein kinase|nr:hypothetical protein [Moraxellaceae bacterium]
MNTLEIPGYSVKRTLGKGGMATVYLAEQTKFERDVALKVMAPALSADAGFRERFLREAKIVAKISHPNIVAVYDVNEVNDVYYIAMEFHPGGDLKARMRGGLTVREALQITKDMARALDFAHSKGYLHRDIKPDNILFRADGSAVLTDFGIAKATEGDANLTQMGMVAGTPKYMSPEQARGQSLDADSDLYSLGVVLFEMLTGRLPFEATDPIALGILHMNAPVPRLEGRIAHFQPLIDRLLAKQAAQRPQSGAQVIREIEALEKGFDFDATAEGPAQSNTVLRPMARKPAAAPAPAATTGSDDATVLTPSAAGNPAVVPPPATAAPLSRKGRIAAAVALVAVLGSGGGWWWQQNAEAEARIQQIGVELAAANAAFSRNALTAPTDDNALLHYRRVLALEPTHPEASAGLQKIVAALQMQASGALAVGRIAEAEQLLEQARTVAPDSQVVTALQQAIADAKAAAVARDTEAARVAEVERTAAEKVAAAEKLAQFASVRQERRAAIREAVREQVAAPAPAPVPAGPDALARLRIGGMLGSARRALDDGDTATAIQRYEQVLRIDPDNREARDGLRQARAR